MFGLKPRKSTRLNAPLCIRRFCSMLGVLLRASCAAPGDRSSHQAYLALRVQSTQTWACMQDLCSRNRSHGFGKIPYINMGTWNLRVGIEERWCSKVRSPVTACWSLRASEYRSGVPSVEQPVRAALADEVRGALYSDCVYCTLSNLGLLLTR